MLEQRKFERWDAKSAWTTAYEREPTGVVRASLKFRLAEAQNWKCCYCGILMNRWRNVPSVCTLEHVIPECAGGLMCWETCVAACRQCNNDLGQVIGRENLVPLNIQFCPKCGGNAWQTLRRHIHHCMTCRTNFSSDTLSRGIFGTVTFGALRCVAGELLVNDRPIPMIATLLARRRLFRGRYMNELATSLAKLAIPNIEVARTVYDDLVEAHTALTADLWELYTPKNAWPPERGAIAPQSNSMASAISSSLSIDRRIAADHQKIRLVTSLCKRELQA